MSVFRGIVQASAEAFFRADDIRPYGFTMRRIEFVGTTIGRPRTGNARPYNSEPRWDRTRRGRVSRPAKRANTVRSIQPHHVFSFPS